MPTPLTDAGFEVRKHAERLEDLVQILRASGESWQRVYDCGIEIERIGHELRELGDEQWDATE